MYFNITKYLTPGTKYTHLDLRRVYGEACDAGMWCRPGDEHYHEGTTFRETVYALWQIGLVEMRTGDNQLKDQDGEYYDFFARVINAGPKDKPDFKIVPGYLVLLEDPNQ